MPTHSRVLVLDSDTSRAAAIAAQLAPAGYDATTLALPLDDAVRAWPVVDVVLLSGTAIAPGVRRRLETALPDASIVVLMGQGSEGAATGAPDGVAATEGRVELVPGEAGWEALLMVVARAGRSGADRRELAQLRARVGDDARQALVGGSPAMDLVRELVGRAAGSRRTVLVTGEAGAGKSTVARMVHDLSERAARPFVIARCDTADPAALEAELLDDQRGGLLESARGGTLVLDEARALPRELYERLTIALVDPGIVRDGARPRAATDVRLILTVRTGESEPPVDAIELLGDRTVLPIALPPLRERRRDIPQLVQHFRTRLARERGAAVAPLAAEAMNPLLAHHWPGNVRELELYMDRIALGSTRTVGETVRRAPFAPGGEFAQLDPARLTLDALERRYILHVLARENGHQSRAAQRLGIDRRTLYRKLKEYREDGVHVRIAG